MLADHPGLITDRTASRMCGVGLKMIHYWIDGRLWPLPHAIVHEVFLFERKDVEDWLGTGEWSSHVNFRHRRAGR
jgi:hypothetical protein